MPNRQLTRQYACSQCGKRQKADQPQDKFDYILDDWTCRPDSHQYIFCNLACLRDWLQGETKEGTARGARALLT